MPKHSNSDPTNEPADNGWSTKTRLILAAIGVAGFIALYLIAIYGLPRWWTNFITGITDESVTTSWLLGAVIGFAFALLPILTFLMGLRLRKSWKGIIGWLLVAVVVALPNIMTLGVRFGSGNAAKTAWTKMSNEAPGFTVASYIGIALGVGVGLWVAWVTYSRRKAKHQAEQLAAKQAEATSVGSGDVGTHSSADGATDSSDSGSSDSGSSDSGDHSADDAHDSAMASDTHAGASADDSSNDAMAGSGTGSDDQAGADDWNPPTTDEG